MRRWRLRWLVLGGDLVRLSPGHVSAQHVVSVFGEAKLAAHGA
ncbi:hypothetical protein DB31_7154 [Hyalangium minutum]|uniref:Uncharacterized protein n=1 Tax=Hyalangium minutum TaxID=394096 RepID=A0A085WJQ4_9BACT|nr:hypothetical protein DB31_7154 [Hyalangium minutum]